MDITLRQLLTLTGDLDSAGSNTDVSSRERFREYLEASTVSLDLVRQLIMESLEEATKQYRYAGSDLTAFLGNFLGFQVDFVSTDTAKGAGVVGLWRSPSGPQVALARTQKHSGASAQLLQQYLKEAVTDDDRSWIAGLLVIDEASPNRESGSADMANLFELPQVKTISLQRLLSLSEFAHMQVLSHADLLNVLTPRIAYLDPLVASMQKLFLHDRGLRSLPEEIVLGGSIYRIAREEKESSNIQTLAGQQSVSDLLNILDMSRGRRT